MQSIQTRLAAGLLLSLIVLLVVQWIIVTTSIHRVSENYIVTRLTHTSDMLVGATSFQLSEQASLDYTRVDPVYSQAFSGHYFRVIVGDQHFRSRSLWDETLPSIVPDTGEAVVMKSTGPQQQWLLMLVKGYEKQGEQIQVTVAEDISALEADINRMLVWHGGVSFFILIVLVVLQMLIVRKNLHPLERIRHELTMLDNGLIDALNENVPREILPLVQEINVRIRAVQQRLQRSRRSTGNLAHALKGPLTLITQLAEQEAIRSNHKIHDALLEYTVSIQRSVDRELKRARLAGAGIGGRHSKLEPELEPLVQSLNAMYRDKSLQIDYELSPDCVTSMDREDMHEMLGNILDNACKWASRKIRIRIDCHDGLSISVEDDGPGIPDDQYDAVLARGKRLDEQTGGHGLGLAIVEDVVEQYRGSIRLKRSGQLGGLQVDVRLPGESVPGHLPS